jgi:hypothetical protein
LFVDFNIFTTVGKMGEFFWVGFEDSDTRYILLLYYSSLHHRNGAGKEAFNSGAPAGADERAPRAEGRLFRGGRDYEREGGAAEV